MASVPALLRSPYGGAISLDNLVDTADLRAFVEAIPDSIGASTSIVLRTMAVVPRRLVRRWSDDIEEGCWLRRLLQVVRAESDAAPHVGDEPG